MLFKVNKIIKIFLSWGENYKNFSLEKVPGAGNFLLERRVKGSQSL